MSIYTLFRDRDYSALASAVKLRWDRTASEAEFEYLHKLAFESSPPVAGGTADQPWSDDSWLLWFRNRLDDLSQGSLGEPSGQAGAKSSQPNSNAPRIGERILITEGTFEGFEADVADVDEEARLAVVCIGVGFSLSRKTFPFSSIRRLSPPP